MATRGPFDYVRIIDDGNQRIVKMRILAAREYEDLLLDQQDQKRRDLKLLRTSFMCDMQYFQLATFTNIEGCPTFLNMESTVKWNYPIHISLYVRGHEEGSRGVSLVHEESG